LDAPFDLGVSSERSCTRAGSVDEYTIEVRGKRKGASCVENNTGTDGWNIDNAFSAYIARDSNCERRFERLKDFVTGSGAEIQKRMASPEIDQGQNRLRSYIVQSYA
jgi:hypothetical protein